MEHSILQPQTCSPALAQERIGCGQQEMPEYESAALETVECHINVNYYHFQVKSE